MHKALSTAVIIYILTGLVLMPDVCIESASAGVLLCINVIIPSLFPFFVCSKILIKNGFADKVSKPLQGIMRPVFNVPGCGAFAFVIGILSGCPVGAKCVADMYSDGLCTKAEAQRMICFCNNSGPLFIIGAVAAGMFDFSEIGTVLYLSHILSAVTAGVIMSHYKKDEIIRNNYLPKSDKKTDYISESVRESVSLTGYVCGFVIFFAVAISIFQQAGIVDSLTYGFEEKNIIKGIVYGLAEMTNGISLISQSKLNVLVFCAVSFIMGFGGLSVILQVDGIISKHKLSISVFVLMKFVQGLLSALYTYIIFTVFQITIPVFMPHNADMSAFNYWAYSIKLLLIFGIAIFILSIFKVIYKILR
ncbi:MAG: hypothetical protein IJQ50_00615 [Clostridia bacterium]|nr:hypothetical protein [Clostridia bacterium]